MSYEDVSEKFRGCAAADWPPDHARQVVDLVSALETLEDVRTLTRLLTR